MGFIFIQLTMLVLTQIRQRQIFEQQVEILVFGDLENEFILTFAILTGVALTAASATAALRPLDTVVLHEVVVARMNAMAAAAASLMENRFVNIVNGNGNGLATFNVGYRTLIDGLRDRLFDLRLITAQKALSVDCAFILAVESPIDEVGHKTPPNVVSRSGSGPTLWVLMPAHQRAYAL